ncbi:hypothetical protein FIA58_007980 [Flavobacterium jejuense]|uniref:NADH dehydrogenase n=1 Tax=Flavobacterium jejuense TaxID=1544455 RepID=A0ABX0IPJ0_9FLAO|nr:hypothetical protein [Flavobacterium jejuense]NHN25613.1 hypothetical protein [Flavobacterium jejuense]
MLNKIKLLYKKVYQKWNYDIQKSLVLNGKILADINNNKKEVLSLDEVEFQVFSQRGEDGVIQYLINKIDIPNKIFVEFGVETYTESNTRFLLINNNWSGLIIDGDKNNINFIKKDYIYWKYDITVKESFITKENINQIISEYTKEKDIGVLSVDIDGNDYWIWKEIECIKPRIVICEYNSVFGDKMRVTVPYNENFIRTKEHYSDLYFGASLAAFCELAESKGYDFIGTTRAGVNAYFVRKDLSLPFKKLCTNSIYNESDNRDSRDEKGNLTFLRHNERLEVIKNKTVFDLEKNEEVLIKECFKI